MFLICLVFVIRIEGDCVLLTRQEGKSVLEPAATIDEPLGEH